MPADQTEERLSKKRANTESKDPEKQRDSERNEGGLP